MENTYMNFGDIVDYVQNDETKGGDLIFKMAEEKKEVDKLILETEKKLRQLKSREQSLRYGPTLVVQHLAKDLPMFVVRENCIVKVEENNISIERNVI